MIRFTDILRQEISGQSNLIPKKSLKGKGKIIENENNFENVELVKKLGKLLNYWKQTVSTHNDKNKEKEST